MALKRRGMLIGTQPSAADQTNMENGQSQSLIASICEEKMSQIKNEFQSTIDTVQAALQLATKNYEKKCCDFEFLRHQLKAERVKNKALQNRVDHLNNTIKIKDELIMKLNHDINNFETSQRKDLKMIQKKASDTEQQLQRKLDTAKDILMEMIAYEKHVLDIEEQERRILTLSDILTDYGEVKTTKKSSQIFPYICQESGRGIDVVAIKEKLKSHMSKPIKSACMATELSRDGRIENISTLAGQFEPIIAKNTRPFHNFTSMVKLECENSALILRKIANKIGGESKLPTANDAEKNKHSFAPQQDLLKRQSDKIRHLKSQMNREKERAAGIFARNKIKFKKELNEEKAFRNSVKTKLEHIICKNRAVIDELNSSRQRAITKDAEVAQEGANQLNDLSVRLKSIENDCNGMQNRVSFLTADIDREFNSNNNLVLRHFLNKIIEMNSNLSEIVSKNRHLTESVQILSEERRAIQLKNDDLKKLCIVRNEMVHQLWERFARAENFRCALTHQKHYLMTVLESYKRAEAKISMMIGSSASHYCRKKPSFKSVGLALIAITRMKIIFQTVDKHRFVS